MKFPLSCAKLVCAIVPGGSVGVPGDESLGRDPAKLIYSQRPNTPALLHCLI